MIQQRRLRGHTHPPPMQVTLLVRSLMIGYTRVIGTNSHRSMFVTPCRSIDRSIEPSTGGAARTPTRTDHRRYGCHQIRCEIRPSFSRCCSITAPSIDSSIDRITSDRIQTNAPNVHLNLPRAPAQPHAWHAPGKTLGDPNRITLKLRLWVLLLFAVCRVCGLHGAICIQFLCAALGFLMWPIPTVAAHPSSTS